MKTIIISVYFNTQRAAENYYLNLCSKYENIKPVAMPVRESGYYQFKIVLP